MDLKKIASTLLGSDCLENLGQCAGASSSDVKNVLAQALPALLNGAKEQADNAETTESFANALSTHAKDNTSSLSGFFSNIDLGDGAKIIGHLLGSNTQSTTEEVAGKTGVSADKTSTILSAAAPLLMSLLGQQADEDDDKESGVGSLMGSLLSNVDLGDVLTGLLSGGDDGKEDDAPASSGGLGGLLGKLVKGLLG